MKNSALEKIPGCFKGGLPAMAGNPIAATSSAFTGMLSAWQEYNRVKETETTKREFIKAQRDVAVTRIQAQKEVLQNYLNSSFKERAAYFTKMFEILDEGLARGDDKAIGVAMNMIVEQVKVNPLDGIAQLMAGNVMDQLNDPNIDCIEI